MNPFGPRALAKMYPYPSCHRGLGKGIIIIIIFGSPYGDLYAIICI